MGNIKKLVEKTTDLLGIQTNILLFHNNPFRICDISANGDWEGTENKLNSIFGKFINYARINKLYTTPIGPSSDYLLNEDTINDLGRLKQNVSKPNFRLAWKLFWFNEDENVFSGLPKKLSEFRAEGLTNHSLAVFYHFSAIQNSLEYCNGECKKINFKLWDSAFEYWSKVLKDEQFWERINSIAEREKKSGYFDLRNFSILQTKEEVIHTIYNTFIAFPLTLIEEELSSNGGEFYFSQFLSCILKSPLGENSLKEEYAKRIFSVRLNKEISKQFPDVQFLNWANNGEFLKLFETGMDFIDKIHTVTQSIQNESQDKDINTTTFLSEVSSLKNIHSDTIKPLVQTLKSNNVHLNTSVSENNIDKTMFSIMVVGLRVLSELQIDNNIQLILKNSIQEYFDKFNLDRLDPKEIKELNKSLNDFPEFINPLFSNHKYLAQYCFFLEGEFAHPEASIFKTQEKKVGNLTKFYKTVIPRSKLAMDFHEGKISKDKLFKELRLSTKLKLVESAIAEIDIEMESINVKILKMEKHIEPINELISNIEKATSRKIEGIRKNAKKREDEEKDKSKEFLTISKKTAQLKEDENEKKSNLQNSREWYDEAKNWIDETKLGDAEGKVIVVIAICIILGFTLFIRGQGSGGDAIIGAVMSGIVGGGILAFALNFILGYIVLGIYYLFAVAPKQNSYNNCQASLGNISKEIKKVENLIAKRIEKEIEPQLSELEKRSKEEIAELMERLRIPKSQMAEYKNKVKSLVDKKLKLLSPIEVKANNTKHPLYNHF
jgi:hypothetical protein